MRIATKEGLYYSSGGREQMQQAAFTNVTSLGKAVIAVEQPLALSPQSSKVPGVILDRACQGTFLCVTLSLSIPLGSALPVGLSWLN